MKVAVINLSGNTGKTTLSKHLLAPLLKARRVQIEDVNSSNGCQVQDSGRSVERGQR